MQRSYIDYAMSVNRGAAPSGREVRDGLKPVHTAGCSIRDVRLPASVRTAATQSRRGRSAEDDG